jgi:hypothetical protein
VVVTLLLPDYRDKLSPLQRPPTDPVPMHGGPAGPPPPGGWPLLQMDGTVPPKNGGGGAAAPVVSYGGGGGGGGATGPPAPDKGDDVESMILKYINDMLSGNMSPYTDQVVQNLKNQAFETHQGATRRRKDALSEELISRGMFRSGEAPQKFTDIGREEEAGYSKDVRDIYTQKTMADYQAKADALDRAQKWLDSRRTYLMQHESNEVQKKIGLAQVSLGYARIQAEKEMLQMQLSRGGGGGGGADDFAAFLQLAGQLGVLNGPGGSAPAAPGNAHRR